MMHPQITRELSRAREQETLRRHAHSTAPVGREPVADPAPRRHRRHGVFSALRLIARLQPRGH